MKQYTIYIGLLALAAFGLAFSVQAKEHNTMRWTQELSEKQIRMATDIIDAMKPQVQTLREDVRNKMQALKEFHYTDIEDHNELARLGHELQQSREALRNVLLELDARLLQEVGVSLHEAYRGRNCESLTEAKHSSARPLFMTTNVQNHNPHHQE